MLVSKQLFGVHYDFDVRYLKKVSGGDTQRKSLLCNFAVTKGECMSINITNIEQREEFTVVQFKTAWQDSIDYITGRSGIEKHGVKAEEISESATVNDLSIINETEFFVFFTDGDILEGAKQNRVLNTSIFLKPKSKTKVPVSCVERGRWHYRSPDFKPAMDISPPSMRAAKMEQVKFKMRTEGMHYADQGEVWARVAEDSSRREVHSDTENYMETLRASKEKMRTKVASFSPDPDANGAAIFIGGTLTAFEVFNRRDVYREYFDKIIHAAAFEAVPATETPQPIPEQKAVLETIELLTQIEKSAKEKHKGVGEGTENRFVVERYEGAELLYKESIVHITALPLPETKTRNRNTGQRRRAREI